MECHLWKDPHTAKGGFLNVGSSQPHRADCLPSTHTSQSYEDARGVYIAMAQVHGEQIQKYSKGPEFSVEECGRDTDAARALSLHSPHKPTQ